MCHEIGLSCSETCHRLLRLSKASQPAHPMGVSMVSRQAVASQGRSSGRGRLRVLLLCVTSVTFSDARLAVPASPPGGAGFAASSRPVAGCDRRATPLRCPLRSLDGAGRALNAAMAPRPAFAAPPGSWAAVSSRSAPSGPRAPNVRQRQDSATCAG